MCADRRIEVYDTTLRDGSQGEGVAFSVSDKLDIVKRLDEIGFDFIEGGWPGSNPKDGEFFEQAQTVPLKRSRLAAFGMTRRAGTAVEDDPTLAGLLATGAGVVTIFGKTWDLHVRDALRTDGDENLRMIEESVAFVVAKGKEVVFDAEHFLDGWKSDASYALECLRAAARGGAGRVVLCDTNGGSLPSEVERATREAREAVGDLPLGIHTHNDGGLAVANALAGVEAGCSHVQGTLNGFGERSGNADLCVLIPALQLKAGYEVLEPDALAHLTELSRYVYEMAMLPPRDFQPYVGRSAFAHKGGVHVSAVQRNPVTYEHVEPETVGNERRVLVSELSGRSTILAKTMGLTPDSEGMQQILEQVQNLEHAGYQFEAAEASFEVLSRKILGTHRPFFKLEGFRVISELDESGADRTEATIKLSVGGEEEHTAAEGNGPVNALDGALRKALLPFYDNLREVQLTNYKVRIVNPLASTAARVLVLIESRDARDRWATVGVSENIIEASWIALVDSVEYKLFKDRTQPPPERAGGP
ncbi:MAG: citramalate synthase [Planctomycetota bacterium]|jgi:2-isopropylmalate synthase